MRLIAEHLPVAAAEGEAVRLDVTEDTGKIVQDEARRWRTGYSLLDGAAEFLQRDASALSDPRCLAFNVAGTSSRLDALQDTSFSVLSPLLLRPEPDNVHDANAVGVWDVSGTSKIGFVPRRLSAAVAQRFRAGRPLGAVITSEYRRGAAAEIRIGVQVVAAPVGTIELNVVPATDARRRRTEKQKARDAARQVVPDLEVRDPIRAVCAALQIVLAEAPPGEGVIVQVKDLTNYYVQFVKSNPDQLYAEAVGQDYLTESEKLSPNQLAAMTKFGWEAPNTSSGKNHWMSCNPAEVHAIDRLARTLLATLSDIYQSRGALVITSTLSQVDLYDAVEQLAPGSLVKPGPNGV